AKRARLINEIFRLPPASRARYVATLANYCTTLPLAMRAYRLIRHELRSPKKISEEFLEACVEIGYYLTYHRRFAIADRLLRKAYRLSKRRGLLLVVARHYIEMAY